MGHGQFLVVVRVPLGLEECAELVGRDTWAWRRSFVVLCANRRGYYLSHVVPELNVGVCIPASLLQPAHSVGMYLIRYSSRTPFFGVGRTVLYCGVVAAMLGCS